MKRVTYYALAHALRQARHDGSADVCAAEFADSPGWAMREEARRAASRIQSVARQLPVSRDPLGFAVMHENWRRRRGHVFARVRQRRAEALQRKRAAMVREPGEGLLEYIDRKCGFVRDAALSTLPREAAPC